MSPRGKKTALRPEEERRLLDEYGIFFDGPLLPRDWPPAYRQIFETIREIGRETYDTYGNDGRLDGRLTVLANVPQIKTRACELRIEAYRCRQKRVNEATWRSEIERFIISPFKAEAVCAKCRKRFWEADFQATQVEYTVTEDLQNRRTRRLHCICSNDERILANVYDQGSNLLFTDLLQTTVLYHPEDRLAEKGVTQREPDRIVGLEHTNTLRQLLPGSDIIRHSPFKDNLISYPFLIIEAKSEKGSPGFESVERQSAFPIRTLLKLQADLQALKNIPINPLVWFMANQGDEWRVYACIVDDTKYRIIDLWHGCMLSLDNTLQILLIADHICDWARAIFLPNVLRCLRGHHEIPRGVTPISAYSFITTTPIDQEHCTLGNLNTITRRTHSLSLESVPGGSFDATSHDIRFMDDESHTDKTFDNNDDHPYLRFSKVDSNPLPWRKHATIRHANMILFSFHIFSLPEEPFQINSLLKSLGESDASLSIACSHLWNLLEDSESVMVSMNAVYELESIWTGREHRLSSIGDYPVRAKVLFHTYIREDWQVVREIHCIVASRFALRALMQMTSMVQLSNVNSGILPDISLATARIHALRCFSASHSLAAALGAGYLRLRIEPSHGGSTPSWVFKCLNERSPLLDLEMKIAHKQAWNPTSLKYDAVVCGSEAPSELGDLYGPISKMDQTGAVLIKKPFSWSAESPEFCLIILDGTSFINVAELGRKLAQAYEATNIYVTGSDSESRMHPLSDDDEIGILRWVDILSGRLPEGSLWLME